MAIFEKEYVVDVSHVGSSKFITNSGILSILENIACKHSDIVGYGFNDIETTNLSWFLLGWKVEIKKRVTYGTKLLVKTWAKKSNKFNTYRDFEVFEENGDLVCIATSKWALIDVNKGRITRITDDIIGKYGVEDRDVFGNPEIEKIEEPSTFSSEYIYNTQRRDIDINNHMNNLNYLLVAYEALPEEVYRMLEVKHVEIMYKKGIVYGDTVRCLYSYEDGSHYITMRNIKEDALNAIIKLY